MIRQVLRTIETYSMLEKNNKIIVGFSGGADSSCLLHVLLALRETYSFAVIAVHINHCLREENSDGDEMFVRGVCARLEIPLEVYRVPVKELARQEGLSLETAGRKARYQSFERALTKYGADKIAVAHHLDDNAETILMNLLRGAGSKGLSGIPPIRGRLIRPLIQVGRKDIEAYCLAHSIAYRTDESNNDSVYLRNKIRRQLIPALLSEYNPDLVETLARTGFLLREEDEYMDSLAAEFHANAWDGSHALSIPALEAHPLAMRRRIIRKACMQYNALLTNLSYGHISQILSLLPGSTGKRVCLPGGLSVEKQYDRLIFTRDCDSVSRFCLTLPHDEFVRIPETGRYVSLSQKKMICPEKLVNICTKIFSYDTIKTPIQIRYRQPGDKIFIRSIGGHKKLKDYFIDNKVPREIREKAPLLAYGSEVLWILDEKSISSGYDEAKCGNLDFSLQAACLYIQIWEDKNE